MEELNNENINLVDEPNKQETFKGLFLGLIYLFVLPSFLYLVLSAIFTSYTLKDANAVMLIAEISSAVITIVAMLLVCKRNFKNILQSFQKKNIGVALKYALLVLFTSLVISYLYLLFNVNVETNANQAALDEAFLYTPVLSVIYTCICAPIVEELTFRYFIFKPLYRKNKILAFILSGASFGLIHMVASLTTFAQNPDIAVLLNDLMSLPIYIAAGVLFCFAYYKTNKIGTSIMAHAFYNTIVTVISLMSIINAPVKIKDVSTSNNSMEFKVETNSELNVTIESIEIYYYLKDAEGVYTDNKQTQLLIDNFENNYYSVDGLESNYVYYVEVKYEYDTTTSIGKTERTEEVISTYAKTR